MLLFGINKEASGSSVYIQIENIWYQEFWSWFLHVEIPIWY